jgi:hypothetical protein
MKRLLILLTLPILAACAGLTKPAAPTITPIVLSTPTIDATPQVESQPQPLATATTPPPPGGHPARK